MENGLTKFRKAIGLTKSAMAGGCGLSAVRYGQLENETVTLISRDLVWVDDAQKIASAIGIPEERLWPQAYETACRSFLEGVQDSSCHGTQPHRPDTAYEQKELQNTIRMLLRTLWPRGEVCVADINMYGYTLNEMAEKFDVTPTRIRQIECKALRMLRHPDRTKRLREFLV